MAQGELASTWRRLAITGLLLASPGIAATEALAQRADAVSAELRALYEADQADRRHSTPPTPEMWQEITKRDGERRARVIELLEAGLLESAADLYHGAMVLQHGEGSEDILLAHILATAAAFEGDERGKWLSAAALDRCLHRTRAPQRLGTQYVKASPSDPYESDPNADWSQGAYEAWLPDKLRAVFGVESREDQEERLRQMNEHRDSSRR